MKIDKIRYAHLLDLADDAVRSVLGPSEPENMIDSLYNSHVPSFGVSILMRGVKPTLAYFKGSTPETKKVLEMLTKMILNDGFPRQGERFETADRMYETVVGMDSVREAEFKRLVLECAAVLKQVVRTYKLV